MTQQDILKLIATNKTEQTLTALSQLSRATDFQSYITQQLARFHRNETAKHLQTITRGEYDAESNRLNEALISFINDAAKAPSVFSAENGISSVLNDSFAANSALLVANAPKRGGKLTVFLSYAREDTDLKKELDAHLAALKRGNLIQTWDDSAIEAGTEWDDAIKTQLADADIILLLVSANFINSDYIWKVEITTAMQRHALKDVVVVPIYMKPCDWKDTPFSVLQGLPRDGVPVTKYADRDEALMAIAKGIRGLVERLTA